jgi:shikimate kinase
VSGNVYLVGMPGSGKSRVGREAAETLGMPFEDLDRVVEEDARCTIAEIFDEYGEGVFREMEHTALERVAARDGVLVACGGGIAGDPANRSLMKASGRVVWLDVPLATLEQRAPADGRRPLLRNDGDLARLLREREPVYRELADVIVDGRDGIAEMVAAVVEAVR